MKKDFLFIVILFFFFGNQSLYSQSTLDFRSRNNGNWNQNSTWERFNGTTWVNATYTPNSSDNIITIRNGHTVTVTANLGVNQMIIELGGKLVHSSGTLNILDGSGVDLLISGEFERTAFSTNNLLIQSGASVICDNTGVYIHNANGGIIPRVTWQDGSLLHIKNSTFSTGNHLVQSFWDVLIEGGDNTALSGTSTISRTMSVRNNFMMTGGTFYIKNSAVLGSNTHRLEVQNDFIQTGGNFNWDGYVDNESVVQLYVGRDLLLYGGDWGGYVSTTKCESGVFFNGNGVEQTFLTTFSHTIGDVRERFYFKTNSGPSGLHEIYQSDLNTQFTIRGNSCGTLPAGFTGWPSSGSILKSVTVNNQHGVTLRSEKSIEENLYLIDGLFTSGGFLTMNENSTLDRSGGSIDLTPLGNSYNVLYSPFSSGYLTGPEIPLSATVLNNLTVNNGNQITIAPEHQLLHINNNLRIESGNFQVEEGYKVVLTNLYENIGGMATFENNSSLIQLNDIENIGSFTYKRMAQQRRLDYVYWSSPVSNFNPLNHASNGPKFIWNTTLLNSNGSQGNWQVPASILPTGKGVIVRGPSSFNNNSLQNLENVFTGIPNNGNIEVPVQRGSIQSGFFVPSTPSDIWVTEYEDNWNLIGNPYPSSISAKQFLLDNAGILTDGIFIWTHGTLPSQSFSNPFYQNFTYNYNSNDYNIYNLSGNLSGPSDDYYIGAAQGFMVALQDGPADDTQFVTFSNFQRNKEFSNETGSQFFRFNTDNLPNQTGRFWLDLIQEENISSRILINYTEGATNQRDALFDALTKNDNHFNLYSLDENHFYRIQGRALPFDLEDRIPLGIEIKEAGNYRFGLAFVEGLFNEAQPIYLFDKYLNVYHDLLTNFYEFTTTDGIFNDRFEIVFQLTTLEVPQNNLSFLHVFRNKQMAVEIFNSNNTRIEEVFIFDVLGRKLYQSKPLKNINQIVIQAIQEQNIIVKVKVDANYYTFKIR